MFDLEAHLKRQMAFSHAAFGPGTRTEGVVGHIRKELVEVENARGWQSELVSEWVDVVILALDGLTRQLAFCGGSRANPDQVVKLAVEVIAAKQTRNEARNWPDWRTAPEGKAIEHVKEPA